VLKWINGYLVISKNKKECIKLIIHSFFAINQTHLNFINKRPRFRIQMKPPQESFKLNCCLTPIF